MAIPFFTASKGASIFSNTFGSIPEIYSKPPATALFIFSQAVIKNLLILSQFLYRAIPTPIKAATPATISPIGFAVNAAFNAHCATVTAFVTTVAVVTTPFKSNVLLASSVVPTASADLAIIKALTTAT